MNEQKFNKFLKGLKIKLNELIKAINRNDERIGSAEVRILKLEEEINKEIGNPKS